MNQNEKVYQRMSEEYDILITEVKKLPADKIMERSYEKVMKEDLLLLFDCGNMDLTKEQARALLTEKYPLDYLYQEWLGNSNSYMDVLKDCATDSILSAEKRYAKNAARSEIRPSFIPLPNDKSEPPHER